MYSLCAFFLLLLSFIVISSLVMYIFIYDRNKKNKTIFEKKQNNKAFLFITINRQYISILIGCCLRSIYTDILSWLPQMKEKKIISNSSELKDGVLLQSTHIDIDLYTYSLLFFFRYRNINTTRCWIVILSSSFFTDHALYECMRV